MGFIIGLLLTAFVILLSKHIVLSNSNERLKRRHSSLRRDKDQLEKDKDQLYHLAVSMDAQLGVLHEKNRQLILSSSTPTLEVGLIKELIVFCHPDKHFGSEKASRLTQKLIKVRDSK